jgi:Zn-dependent protease/CBS domain-containing protein
MRQNIRLGSIAGIEVGLNWSVVVILALFAWELGLYVLPARPGHASASDWIAGIVGALVLLASVLLHEVSHAVVARHNDVKVRSITLFVFGGVAQLEGEAHTPGADFRIAAAGPATSLALAGAFGAAQAVLTSLGLHGLPVATLSWLWQINLLLAVFNLVPGAPLDGGRILRALLWRRSGDRLRSSVQAAHAGRIVGLLLGILGLLAFVSTGSIIGLWPALIGFFVYTAARAEERFTRMQGSVAGLTVGQVMTVQPPAVHSNMSVADVAAILLRSRCDALTVTDQTGRPAGVVTSQAVKSTPNDRRARLTAADVAISAADLPTASVHEPVTALLDRMMAKQGNPALVFDAQDRLVGIVTISDIDRVATLRSGQRFPTRSA